MKKTTISLENWNSKMKKGEKVRINQSSQNCKGRGQKKRRKKMSETTKCWTCFSSNYVFTKLFNVFFWLLAMVLILRICYKKLVRKYYLNIYYLGKENFFIKYKSWYVKKGQLFILSKSIIINKIAMY